MAQIDSHITDSSRSVYAVAGGNHIKILLDRDATAGKEDLIEVTSQPGGGPPPHRHAFAEWFRVLEGELTFIERRDGAIQTTRVITGGEVYVAPWTVHATLNLGEPLCRFEVTSRPGVMSGYAKEAGVSVPDELTAPSQEPPGPSELGAVAARWVIEFCDPDLTAAALSEARS